MLIAGFELVRLLLVCHHIVRLFLQSSLILFLREAEERMAQLLELL